MYVSVSLLQLWMDGCSIVVMARLINQFITTARGKVALDLEFMVLNKQYNYLLHSPSSQLLMVKQREGQPRNTEI